MRTKFHILVSALCSLLIVSGTVAHATTYTSDANVSDFTSGLVFGTFTSAPGGGDVGVPYTPTPATINSGLRVIGSGGGAGAIIVQFPTAVSFIRVFPNIDHFGAAYDGYQYTIEGSNDGVTYTPLFDALTVVGAGEPFTLGTFTGTAPTRVNNVLTPGAGPSGTVGYEADFTFGTAYRFYAFGGSTIAIQSGNTDQELSAVGTVPEPTTLATILAGLAVLATARALRNRSRQA